MSPTTELPPDGRPAPLVDAPAAAPGARLAARREAQRLCLRAQTDLAGTTGLAWDLVSRAVSAGWWDVALLAEYAGVIGITNGGDGRELPAALDQLVRWAERCGDPASLALADAARSRMAAYAVGDEMSPLTDSWLATAVVLLESADGRAVERAMAHVECGLCFGLRRMWELEVEQYQLAAAVDVAADDPGLDADDVGIAGQRAAVVNNMAEVEAHLMASLYMTGALDELRHRVDGAREALRSALGAGLPPEWMPELEALAVLVEALAGTDARHEAAAVADRLEPGTPFAGIALLAQAMSWLPVDPAEADRLVELAVAALADSDLTVEHELALHVAVELEASRLGAETRGLRLARHHHRRRNQHRMANVHSMRALIAAERFRAERESLARDARFDELTGIANRRGYHRFVGSVERAGSEPVALLVVDVDRFKDINDRFGHDAGDRALQRVAGVIAGQARTGDLAARMGGDEFVLILSGADLGAARRRAEQIVVALSRPGRGADYEREIEVSIGVAAGTAEQIEGLARSADAALYRAKSAGGHRAVVAPDPPGDGPVALALPGI